MGRKEENTGSRKKLLHPSIDEMRQQRKQDRETEKETQRERQ